MGHANCLDLDIGAKRTLGFKRLNRRNPQFFKFLVAVVLAPRPALVRFAVRRVGILHVLELVEVHVLNVYYPTSFADVTELQ